jgi:hypothetical protein
VISGISSPGPDLILRASIPGGFVLAVPCGFFVVDCPVFRNHVLLLPPPGPGKAGCFFVQGVRSLENNPVTSAKGPATAEFTGSGRVAYISSVTLAI